MIDEFKDFVTTQTDSEAGRGKSPITSFDAIEYAT